VEISRAGAMPASVAASRGQARRLRTREQLAPRRLAPAPTHGARRTAPPSGSTLVANTENNGIYIRMPKNMRSVVHAQKKCLQNQL